MRASKTIRGTVIVRSRASRTGRESSHRLPCVGVQAAPTASAVDTRAAVRPLDENHYVQRTDRVGGVSYSTTRLRPQGLLDNFLDGREVVSNLGRYRLVQERRDRIANSR